MCFWLCQGSRDVRVCTCQVLVSASEGVVDVHSKTSRSLSAEALFQTSSSSTQPAAGLVSRTPLSVLEPRGRRRCERPLQNDLGFESLTGTLRLNSLNQLISDSVSQSDRQSVSQSINHVARHWLASCVSTPATVASAA